jgi:hypothetical protein
MMRQIATRSLTNGYQVKYDYPMSSQPMHSDAFVAELGA